MGVTVARWVLGLSAIPFVGIGLAFLIAPGKMASLVSISLSGPTADGDVRAVYGGLQIGLAVFFVLAAARPTWHRPALVAQILAFGCLAGSRFVSWAAVGLPGALGLALHAGEVLGLAAGLLALWASVPALDEGVAATRKAGEE